MRVLLTVSLLAGLAARASAGTPTARAIGQYGDVVCDYSSDQRTFTMSVGPGLSTDEVAVVLNQHWNWLQRAPVAGGVVVRTGPARTTVTIPIDTIARRSAAQRGGRVFPSSGDYSIRIGSALDSEDSLDIVACRYRVSR